MNEREGGGSLQIGFVGLGDMGSAIVARLISAGHTVTGWNRTRAKAEPLVLLGMRWADSPREAAHEADAVFSIVTDTEAVKAVALGKDGILAGIRKGGVYVDMSTIDPDGSRAVASEFAKTGARMLDAPISGTAPMVSQGKASLMVGGDEQVFERMKPLLLAIGPKVTYIGRNGLAVQLKVALNLTLVVEVIAFCEGVAMAEKGGVPRETAVNVMMNSVVASPVIGYRAPMILKDKFPETAFADVNLQQKDMMLALEQGRKLGIPVPLTAAANELLNACRGLGFEHRDFVTVYEVYRRMGGMQK